MQIQLLYNHSYNCLTQKLSQHSLELNLFKPHFTKRLRVGHITKSFQIVDANQKSSEFQHTTNYYQGGSCSHNVRLAVKRNRHPPKRFTQFQHILQIQTKPGHKLTYFYTNLYSQRKRLDGILFIWLGDADADCYANGPNVCMNCKYVPMFSVFRCFLCNIYIYEKV